jgi:glycosyltransferase involved in cell wall biosynthesis
VRILIVYNTVNDSFSISGVLRHYAYMAKAWIALGHPTDFVIAKVGWPQMKDLVPEAGLISSDGIFSANRYLAKTWRYFPAYGYRMLNAHWLRLPAHYDVVIGSSQLIFEVYPAFVLARRQHAKVAFKVHHVLAAQPGRRGLFDRLFLWAERTCVRWMNRRADLVICSTPIVDADYHALEAKLGLSPGVTRVHGYGTDLAALAPKTDQAKEYDVVFLGRLHEHKGVFDLPDFWRAIVAQRPQGRLLVIGEGPRRAETVAKFDELGLSKSVTFTGGISEREKNDCLSRCRVGVSLSYEEGWGLSVLEFLASGLPVVAYELPVFAHAFPDQLEVAKLGDWRGLAERAQALLSSEPECRRRGQAGRRFVERYDYRRVAQAELGALQALVLAS